MTVAGTYAVTIQTPMGEQNGAFTVMPDGAGGFSGKVTGGIMGSLDVENGKVDGDRLTWTMEMTAPMPIALECEATVDGDAIAGTVKAGAFGTLELSGTRTGD